MKVKDVIVRDLGNEPQPTVRVYEDAQLKTDFVEYVLTDGLAHQFDAVLSAIVQTAKPAAPGTNSVGIWVSGFYGSGKSHFAKVAGHILADTPVDGRGSRDRFRELLRSDRPAHERVRELLQEMENYGLSATLVPFDIQTTYSPQDGNVAITFLRALYRRLGLSALIPFAERELELRRAGLYEDFVRGFEADTGRRWEQEKHFAKSLSAVARCLANVLAEQSADEYRADLELEQNAAKGMTIEDVTRRLIGWLDSEQEERPGPHRLVFVADEVGAWAGGHGDRIEQVRGFVEHLGVVAQGRIWLVATSQERLSDVVQRIPGTDGKALKDLQQRLEARFRINVHLESSEVGTVIEERILDKKAAARPALEELWRRHKAKLAGIASPPGIEVGGNYPDPDLENFVRDYPFLPYQIPAAADLFGAMRCPKVSPGARSMLKVVFDAVRTVADDELGRVVSWDGIFDSANSENEFADERYLGGQGLDYLLSADRDVQDAPIQPSRVLKVLWLTQWNPRVPRTAVNLARLLVDDLGADVVQLERDVEATLQALAERSFVRLEPATGQWKFLTQDQVTVEKIVQRIAEEDVRVADVREATEKLFDGQLRSAFSGRITHGRSSTAFDYGLYYGDTPLKNEDAPVSLRLSLEGTPSAQAAVERGTTELDAPVVHWVVPVPQKLEERLRRVLAIERLPADEELRRVATDRTRAEVDQLSREAEELRSDLARDVSTSLSAGTLYYGGKRVQVGGPGGRAGRGGTPTCKAQVEEAVRERIDACYPRFREGDLRFDAGNVEKVLAAVPADRADLDPDLGFFGPDGHLLADHPVLEAVSRYLSTSTKNSGNDLIEHFRKPPYGWPADLLRYAVAALFLEGRVTPKDQHGKVWDDPRTRETRALFGTAAFRKARFDIEEQPLTPAEREAARTLLSDLGVPPEDPGEIALKEAVVKLAASLLERGQAVVKAREAGVPLPAVFDRVDTVRQELLGAGSRPKVVRALLANDASLREIDAALRRVEAFVQYNGPERYRRARELLDLALEAGLADDPEHGPVFSEARDEWAAVEEQGRVLEEWDGKVQYLRARVVEAYRSIYVPLREALARRVQEARATLTSMPEYDELTPSAHAQLRLRFLAEGRTLAEVSVPELRDEEQLVRASRELSIPHIRARLSALDGELAEAKALLVKLAAAERAEGEPEVVLWNPGTFFSGRQFSTEEEVETVFEDAKGEVKALIRDGKVVRIL